MHILVNAMSARLGGGQTYLLNLLCRVPRAGRWRISVLALPSFPDVSALPNVNRIHAPRVLENPFVRVAWEHLRLGRLARSIGADVLFSPGGLLPRGLSSSLRTAVTFQNMLPFDHDQRRKYPIGYRRLRDWLLERGLSSSMRRADLVIFISEYARAFIGRAIGAVAGRHAVIPHGLDDMFRVDRSDMPRPPWLPSRDYLLYVSFLDHYKAQIEVVRGFDLYRRFGGSAHLVLAGPEYRPYRKLLCAEIKARGLDACVTLAGSISHEELPAVYRHALANVFASYTENCPNILLEMMAAGRPTLVSNRGPMPEFGGDSVVYFDPGRPEELAAKLTEVLSDSGLMTCLGRAAAAGVVQYTWDETAARTWHAMGELVS